MLGRLRQVGYYLAPRLDDADRAWVAARLTPAQLALYEGMGLPDQAHAVRVARRLAEQGAPEFVLEAALLHDCAKPASYGLFWRSAGVVLVQWLKDLPAEPRLSGWRGQLQTYRWHDQWGLEAARAAGTSPEALALLEAYLMPTKEAAPAWLGPLKACDDLG